MSFKLGTTDIANVRVGNTAVSKLMLGTTQVWPLVIPEAPSNVQAVTASPTSTTLTWDATPMATSYVVEYRQHKAKDVEFADEFDYANGTDLGATAAWDSDWGTLIVNAGAISAQGIQDDSLVMLNQDVPVDGYAEIRFISGGNNYTGVSMRHDGLVGSNPRTEIVAEINPAGYFEIAEFIAEPEGSATHDTLAQTGVIYPGAMPSPVDMRLEFNGRVARMYLDNVLTLTGYVIANMTGVKSRTGGWVNTTHAIYRYEMGTFTVGPWIPHSTPTAPSVTVTGLLTGFQYDFRVAAVNVLGQSPFSAVATSAAGLGVPTISTVTPSSATGSGVPVAVTGTNFVPDATSVTFDNGAEHPAVVKSFTTLDFTTPAHAAGATALRVRTPNGDSAPVTFTFGAATVPGAPTGLGATPGSAQVALTWTAPASNGGSPITDYVIEKSANGTSGWTVVPESVSTATNYTVTGLTNGVIQYFRVIARNAIGDGVPSNVASATPVAAPTAPGVPTGLSPSAGDGQVALTWTAPASNGGSAITDYTVQYRTTAGPGAWNTFSHTASTATAITVTGLTNGTGYDFQIAAVNAIGTGSYSSTVSATPVSSGPGVVASDNFNRADGALGIPWTGRSGSLAIASNRVIVPTASLDSLYQHSTHGDLNGYVQADVRQDNGYIGISAAITAPFRRDVSLVIYPDGTVHLEEQPGGNNLGPAWSGYIAGTTVTARLEWNITPGVSADYRVYIGGVLRVSGTSTAHTAATYGIGMGGYRISGLTTFDNFEMGTL